LAFSSSTDQFYPDGENKAKIKLDCGSWVENEHPRRLHDWREGLAVFVGAHFLMPWTGRETLCTKCEEERKPERKVYMHFMLMNGGYCQFLEEDLKTPLPCKLNLDDPSKIMELARRGGAPMKLEDKQAIEYGIETRRGSVWLNLTQEQYQKLVKGAVAPSRGTR
jgi:hypothetical protein